MEQLSFDIFETSSGDLHSRLEKIIKEVCDAQNVDVKYISLEYGKTEVSKKDCETGKMVRLKNPKINKNKISVWICEPIDLKATARSFCIEKIDKKEVHRFEVEISYSDRDLVPAPEDADYKLQYSKKLNTYKAAYHFPLTSTTLDQYLHDFFTESLKKFEPTEKIGCCGKYVQCSDAKKCLHDNLFYAKCCMYRKNLESGKIFYGENANI